MEGRLLDGNRGGNELIVLPRDCDIHASHLPTFSLCYNLHGFSHRNDGERKAQAILVEKCVTSLNIWLNEF